jgi:hypothetical protein
MMYVPSLQADGATEGSVSDTDRIDGAEASSGRRSSTSGVGGVFGSSSAKPVRKL